MKATIRWFSKERCEYWTGKIGKRLEIGKEEWVVTSVAGSRVALAEQRDWRGRIEYILYSDEYDFTVEVSNIKELSGAWIYDDKEIVEWVSKGDTLADESDLEWVLCTHGCPPLQNCCIEGENRPYLTDGQANQV